MKKRLQKWTFTIGAASTDVDIANQGADSQMKRYLLAVCYVVFALPVFAGGDIRRVREPIPNQYIVVLDDKVVRRDLVVNVATEMSLRHQGHVLAVFKNGVRGYAIELTDSKAQALALDPRVAWVEENAVGHLSYNVRYFSDDTFWHLDRIDQRTSIPLSSLKAYGWTSTGQGVDVYVVDTGIQAAHAEFSPGYGGSNVTTGANYAIGDGFQPSNPCGGFINRYNGGHGTAVASIIGGAYTGVAPGVTLIPVKVAQCHPYSQPDLTIDAVSVLTSLDWVLGQIQANPSRRAVVNMSLYFDATTPNPNGIPGCYNPATGGYDCRPALENNVRNILNAGGVVVASANNQNMNHCGDQSPARMGYGGMFDPGNQPSWPFVITVGGTDINDNRYQCAACDATERGSNVGPCVDVYAPARNIHGAHIASPTAYRDQQVWVDQLKQEFPGSYPNLTTEVTSTGTSFSAPVVSGIAARLLQMFPTMTVRQVWDNIHDNATGLPYNFDGDGVPANDRLAYISVYN